ncbi:MAG TPA: AI-2E family transporter [Bacteroidales bacterium]|nr:AI-2E family transporter [Bacteroidales bacterium]
MNNNGKEIKLPFYAKASIILIGLYAFVYILYLAQGIILPLIFAAIAASLLHPVVNKLIQWRMNRVFAIVLTITMAILVFAGIALFLFSKTGMLSESVPKLIDKLADVVNQATTYASGHFDISEKKINNWVEKTRGEMLNTSSAFIGKTIIGVGSGLILLLLIPVYIFMILFYHPLVLEFFSRLFGADRRVEVHGIISDIKMLIQRYLVGLMMETGIIAILFTTGLLILGIDYAIFFGVLGAFLNLIPYVGAWIAAALPMLVAVATKPSLWYALLVMGVYIVVQFIDNNIIVPRIVASQVRINALVSIFVVIAFSALWGIPGMFLSIPLTAIVKLIFEHIEQLKPWGYLLGDDMPVVDTPKPRVKKETP